MTEAQVRQKPVSILQSWVGRNEGDGSHKAIINIYNEQKKLPRGYKVKYTDSWCATAYSAAAIEAGLTDIMPVECSCGRLVELAIEMGCWQEKDNYVPAPGDAVLYDWDDNGVGDNTGWPEHIGTVEAVVGNVMTIIEGNIKDSVGRRNLKINAKYIRGFITPNFASKADTKEEVVESAELKVGDVVNFTGSKHYGSSYTGARSSKCKSGKARVTAISKGKAHPYHLVAVSGGGSNVYGWVDEADIKGVVSVEIKVGDEVTYSGDVHYTSCYDGATAKKCKGGTAKVTAIRKGKKHPYHLVHTGKGCTVYGWVDSDKVTK